MIGAAAIAAVDVGERVVEDVKGESVSEFEGDKAAEEDDVVGISSETQSLCPLISSTKDVKSWCGRSRLRRFRFGRKRRPMRRQR